MDIRTFLLPYDSARRNDRMGAGPQYWLDNGLEAALQARGHTVCTKLVEAQDDFPTEIKTSFDLYRSLAAEIQRDCAQGQFPLVLSGNCGAAIGGINGLHGVLSDDLGVVWFDAHGDFNIPDTTRSGFLDGMGLATAAGLGWKALAKTLPGFRPVLPSHILHVGGRDFDPAEERLFAEQGVGLVTGPQVREQGIQAALQPAVDALRSRVREIYLHFDVDVLDPTETPANHFPAPGGLYPEEAAAAFRMLRSAFAIRGMGIASFDPKYDSQRKTLQAVMGLLEEVVG